MQGPTKSYPQRSSHHVQNLSSRPCSCSQSCGPATTRSNLSRIQQVVGSTEESVLSLRSRGGRRQVLVDAGVFEEPLASGPDRKGGDAGALQILEENLLLHPRHGAKVQPDLGCIQSGNF